MIESFCHIPTQPNRQHNTNRNFTLTTFCSAWFKSKSNEHNIGLRPEQNTKVIFVKLISVLMRSLAYAGSAYESAFLHKKRQSNILEKGK